MAKRHAAGGTAETDARDRVREIAVDLSEPRSANWIQQAADVRSVRTVRDELEKLVEFGRLQHAGDDGETLYEPADESHSRAEVSRLLETHSVEDLQQQLDRIDARIAAWQEAFECESRVEFERSVRAADLDRAEVRERNRILRKWARYEDTRRHLKQALPGSEGSTESSSA
jgi:hypothetical protein